MNIQTPVVFPHSLRTTASWLDLKPPTNPTAFSLPMMADNPGMVSQRYLNTKMVLFARNKTRIILQLECFQVSFSKSILAARSFTLLTCTGPVLLQQRCLRKKCGWISKRPSFPQLVCGHFGPWCTPNFFFFKWPSYSITLRS